MPDNTVKELYFIDMDGVLARYDYNAYDKNKGRKPGIAIYEDPDLHYFRNLKPDPIAINITKNLLKKPGAKTYILTTVAPHIPWAIDDKKKWLAEHLPEIKPEDIIFAENDKAEIVKIMKQIPKLTKRMFLIDDYKHNLEDWEIAGGTPIKYLNGINSIGDFKGLYISNTDTSVLYHPDNAFNIALRNCMFDTIRNKKLIRKNFHDTDDDLITLYHGTSYRNGYEIFKIGFDAPHSIWNCSDDTVTYFAKQDDDTDDAINIAIDASRISAAYDNQINSANTIIIKLTTDERTFNDFFRDDASDENATICYEINSRTLNKLIKTGDIKIEARMAINTYDPEYRPFYIANVSQDLYNYENERQKNICKAISNADWDCIYDELFSPSFTFNDMMPLYIR